MSTIDEEVDLIDILRKIFSFVVQNKWVLIVVFVLGAILGYYKTNQKSNPENSYYKNQFVVNTSFLTSNQIYMVGSDIAQRFPLSEKSEGSDFLKSIDEVKCTRESIGGAGSAEVNIIFESKDSIPIEQFVTFVRGEFESNELFKRNYKVENEHWRNMMGLIEAQLGRFDYMNESYEDKKVKTPPTVDDSELLLAYVKLLEKQKEVKFKIDALENAIQCVPIQPAHKYYPAPKFSYFSVFIYGVILSIFSALIILLLRLLKLVVA